MEQGFEIVKRLMRKNEYFVDLPSDGGEGYKGTLKF